MTPMKRDFTAGYICATIFWIIVLCEIILAHVGCAAEPRRYYNLNDSQDPDCYKNSAARPGYCDKSTYK